MAVIATAADELNAILPDVSEELEDTIRHASDFIDWLLGGATKHNFDGDLRQKALDTAKAVKVKGIYEGNESLPFRVKERTQMLEWRGHRAVATLAVFNRDLAVGSKNARKQKVLDLYADLPKLGALNPVQNLERYILCGDVLDTDIATATEYQGWMCLYGGFTSGKVMGMENGMLQLAAPAAQNAKTLNLAKSQALGHYNQYGNITSMSADGERTISKLLSDCVYNDPSRTDPEVIWVDRDSYVEYGETRKNRLIIVDNSRKDDQAANEDFHPINGYKTKMRITRAINPAVDFAGTAAAKGIGYVLHAEDFEYSEVEPLRPTQWVPLNGTDMTIMQMPWHFRMALLRHRRNGVLTGFHNA